MALMPSILEQLKLTHVPGMLMISVSSDIENEGMAQKVFGLYVVGIKTGQTTMQTGVSLCHEMVHIKQLQTGKLRIEEDDFIWNGKRYPDETPYLSQPWELQAFAQQEIIFRRAFETC